MNKMHALLLGAALVVSLSSSALAQEAAGQKAAKPKAVPVEVKKPKAVEAKKEAAGKTAEAPAGAKQKTAKGKPVSPAKDSAAGAAKEKEVVLASFEAFSKEWIAKSNRNFQASSVRKQIVPSGNGWLARYHEIDGSTLELEIQPTGLKIAPFTGALKYLENTWECAGQDQRAAEGGQFVCVKSVKITEIFRYQNNVWKY